IFFFQRVVNHRDLHSFPTRRSSDLLEIGSRILEGAKKATLRRLGHERARRERERVEAARFSQRRQTAKPAATGLWFRRSLIKSRSEEHTSELQSRGHLVCRLLLEKK